MPILKEYASMITTSDLMKVIQPFLDLGSLVKGELKRNIVNINTALTWVLGPELSGKDFNDLMKKNKDKQKVIDGEVAKFMDKYPMSTGASVMLFMANPGLMVLKGTRDVSKKVTPESVEYFMKEYGFDDLAISRIPVGKMLTRTAAKAAGVGNFATGVGGASTRGRLSGDNETKWYTPLERLFLLQRPFKDRHAESFRSNKPLLLEADDDEVEDDEKENRDQGQDFLNVLDENGFMDEYYQKVAVPYIKIHDENISGLMDAIEQDIADVALVAAAGTLEEFVQALKKAQGEKFKAIPADSIMPDVEKSIAEMMEPDKKKEKELAKILKIKKKKREDFEDDEKLKEFLITVIFEKEFAPSRVTALQSLEQATEEVKDEILGDMQEKDLVELADSGVIGAQLAKIMKDGIDRLEAALAKLQSAEPVKV